MSSDYVDEREGSKGKAIVIAIIIVVLALVAAAWAIFTPGYISKETAVKNYFKAISDENVSLYKKSCYPSKWAKNYDNVGVGIDDMIKGALNYQSGAKYSDIKFVSEEKLDKSYAQAMSDSLQNIYKTNMKVSQIVRISFTLKTSFEGRTEDTGTITRYCYKTGGKWYFLSDPSIIVDVGLE